MHRFKRVGFLGALAAALTLSGVGFAQPPFGPTGSHRDPGTFIEENAEALDLDDETRSAIRSIVAESKDAGDELHSKVRELHKGMKALLSQGTPDESAVMKQVDAIGVAEVEMHRHRLGTMLKIRALLTPEQREEMTRLREDSRGRWRHALLEECEADLEALCPEADDRWSRKQCLREQREEVSPTCRDAIRAAKRDRHGSHKGCPMHRGPGCPECDGSGCPECDGSDCPMHRGVDCPMHQGGDCPMHRGADCPMRNGAGSSEKPGSGGAY
jgi:Spy/CpxP family protein refolding chaperone